jgi:hypothetical protein
MRNRDKSTRRQITSDFQKSRQARESKIFRFTCRANQRHVSARLTRWRGARERHERAVGCDGRGWRAGRCAPEAYGEVVWFGRRGAGVKRAIRSAGDGGKRAVLREEHEVSRKAIAQGRPECSRCPVCSCALLFSANRTRDRGCSKHPVFPAPSVSKRAKRRCKPRAKGVARMRSYVHRHCERSEAIHLSPCRGMDCFAALAMTVQPSSPAKSEGFAEVGQIDGISVFMIPVR